MNNHDRAVKAGLASGQVRTKKSAPRIRGVRASYVFLRGMVKRKGLYASGRKYLYQHDPGFLSWETSQGMSNAEAVSILSDVTGLTKKRILQIVPDLRAEADALGTPPPPANTPNQLSIFDLFPGITGETGK